MINPSLAASYDVEKTALREKFMGVLIYVMPTGVIVFLVIGLILLGTATPPSRLHAAPLVCSLLFLHTGG